MNQKNFLYVHRFFLTVLLTTTAGFAYSDDTFHTTPDRWKEPRIFFTPSVQNSESGSTEPGVKISRVTQDISCRAKVPSPNKAYWIGFDPEHGYKKWDKPNPGASFSTEIADVPLYVFNEKEYLIKIMLKDHLTNFGLRVQWINEKLVYIRVWWGRVVGSDIIFDVEKEVIVYDEIINDGGLAFMQWTGARERLNAENKNKEEK